MPIAIFIVAGLFLFLAPVLHSGTVGEQLIGWIGKGSRVGPKSTSDDDETINENPLDLAAAAGLDINVYTFGRAISSEEGNSSEIRQIAVAWVMRNNAGQAIFLYACGGGAFGRQGGIRKVTTFVDPYQRHIDIANRVMSGAEPDPTGGATEFVTPKSQEALHKKNPAKYRPFAEVHQMRLNRGLTPVEVDGIDPDYLIFYRRA